MRLRLLNDEQKAQECDATKASCLFNCRVQKIIIIKLITWKIQEEILLKKPR